VEDIGEEKWNCVLDADSKILSCETARLIVGVFSLVSGEAVDKLSKLSRDPDFSMYGVACTESDTTSIGGQVESDELVRSCRRAIDDKLLAVVGGVGNSRKNLECTGVVWAFAEDIGDSVTSGIW